MPTPVSEKQGKPKTAPSARRAGARVGTRAKEPHAFLWTAEQYLRLADMGWFRDRRVELVRGEIVEVGTISNEHWVALWNMPETLRQALPSHCDVLQRMPLQIDSFSEPQPDLMVLKATENLSKDSALQHTILVIEISDTTLQYDRTTKATLYAEAGILEYWIINVKAKQVEVFREPKNGRYSEKFILDADSMVSLLAAPEVKIKVAELLPSIAV